MPRNALLLSLSLAALLGGCGNPPAGSGSNDASPAADPAADPASASAADAAAANALAWDASVVWEGDLNACRQGDSATTRTCLLDAMRNSGASAAALTAATQLSSGGELAYVSAWHEHEGIGVATVTYPFRANTNEGTRLVDAQGKRIDVDAAPAADGASTDPNLQVLLQAHPDATPFAPAQAAGSAPLENGGIRLLYRTPLRQCHACVDVGQLPVAYDFDAQRRFIGQQVVPEG